jgi:hypothetical protein
MEDRWPMVNVYEAMAFTLPGIVALQSALKGGGLLKIGDSGTAPAQGLEEDADGRETILS